jgi:hypothetical protein
VARDDTEREDTLIASDLGNHTCLREWISKHRRVPLILHADNVSTMPAAPSRPGWSSEGCSDSSADRGSQMTTPNSESLLRTEDYSPIQPSRPLTSEDGGCLWAPAFVDWYNHLHRHNGIRFVTP